jgi:lipopolysaccharide transport system permease protein
VNGSNQAATAAIDPATDRDENWMRVIRPKRAFFHLPFRELWRYRDLIKTLSARDVATSYKQTVLGPLWFVFQPLLVTAVFSFLFGRMAQFQSDSIPHYLFYMGGLVPWGYFSESVLKSSNVFVENSMLFSKVYFPRLCVPLSSLLTNLVPTAVQFLLFLLGLGFYLLKDDPFTHPNWWILLTPLVFVQLGALALGIGCIVSSLSRRFRDLAFGVKIGLQLLMFGSAIVFPLSRLAPGDRWIFLLNPVVPPIEFFRYAFVGRSLVGATDIAISAAVSFATLFIGLLLFHRAEQNAMDTV